MKFPRLHISELIQPLATTAIAASVAIAPLPALANEPAAAPAEAAASAEAAVAQVGGTVSVLRFDGGGSFANEVRTGIISALEEQGYTPVGINLDVAKVTKRNKCEITDADCLEKIGKYLNRNARKPANFFVYATFEEPTSGKPSKVFIHSIDKNEAVGEVAMTFTTDDLILPIKAPSEVAQKIADYQVAPAPATEDEKLILATLDEPEKTPEEEVEEKRRLDESEAAAAASSDTGPAQIVEADLRKDFDEYCRKGGREDKEQTLPDGSVIKVPDRRPVCKRGKFWGYLQARSWVTLSIAVAGAVGTMGFYGMALGARSRWDTAKTNLAGSALGTDNYRLYAPQVSIAGDEVRKSALAGDAMLGLTLVMTGVTAIMIKADRSAAQRWMTSEKMFKGDGDVKQITDLRIAPIIAPRGFGSTYGASAGFRF